MVIDDRLRMSVSQSRALAAGIALKLGAWMVLAIALVRMYAALLGQHFELVWAALPFLGVGLGALLCVPWARSSRPPFRIASIAHATAFSAGASCVAIVFGIRAKSVDVLDRASLLQLALFVGTSLLPFVLAGVSLVATLFVAQRNVGQLGKRGLYGAACGVIAATFVMPFGPARVGLGAAIALAFAAALLARASRRLDFERPAHPSVVATFVLGCSVLLAGEIGAPYLKVAALRWNALERVDWQAWTDRGLFTLDKPQAGGMFLRVDGVFGVSIPDGKQQPPVAADELAYVISKEKGPVLILGAGGGREIRVALRQGQKEIFAVEPEPIIVNQLMRGRSQTYSGEVYDKEEVHILVEGLRSAPRRSPAPFRNIFVPYVETLVATPTGSLAATPYPLLTVEAVTDMLLATDSEGTVSVSRPEAEADRVIALLTIALQRIGAAAPVRHVFGCTKDKIATVFAKHTVLRKDELTNLRTFCRKNKLAEVVSPDLAKENPKRMLLDGLDAEILSEKQGINIVPPTDDRPFWFSTTAPGNFIKSARDILSLKENQKTLFFILAGVCFSAFFGFLAFFGSFTTSGHHVATRKENGRASVGLAALVAATVLITQALQEKLLPIVGRADLAAMFLPFVVFLGLGTGFGYASRPKAEDAHIVASHWALGFLFVASPLLMVLGPLLNLTLTLSILARLGIAACLLGLATTALGGALALGARIAASRGERALSWSISLAATTAAIALLLGTLLAIVIGYSPVLLTGCAFLLLAIVLLPHAKRSLETPLARPTPIQEDRTTPIGERVTLPELEVSEVVLDQDFDNL